MEMVHSLSLRYLKFGTKQLVSLIYILNSSVKALPVNEAPNLRIGNNQLVS